MAAIHIHKHLKKRLKPAYLLFLILPLAYYLFSSSESDISYNKQKWDYFYFSVKTSNHANLNLYTNQHLVASWKTHPNSFKNLGYVGNMSDSTVFNIIITQLNAGDSIIFSGFNFFLDDTLLSICKDFEKHIYTNNLTLSVKNGLLTVIIQENNKPATITLKPARYWQKTDTVWWFNIMIAAIFILAFFLVFLLNPPTRPFVVTVFVALLVLSGYYLADSDPEKRIVFSSDTNINEPEIYYSETPFFSSAKRYTFAGTTKKFNVPLDFSKNCFIRCDFDEKTEPLSNLKISFKSGLFSYTYDISSIFSNNVLLNDISINKNKVISTGKDSYVMFATVEHLNKIHLLILISRNTFLYISLLTFILLLLLHKIFPSIQKLYAYAKFRPAYLVFMIIPATYLLVSPLLNKKSVGKKHDQIYFSARTSRPANVILINGNDTLYKWQTNSDAFKYLHYNGEIKKSEGLQLMFKNLSSHDTISLTSVNLYINGKVYNLFDKNEHICNVKNTTLIYENDHINAIVHNPLEPVSFYLIPHHAQKNSSAANSFGIIIMLFFALFFVFILYIGPSTRYFVISCFLTAFIMLVFYWIGNDVQWKVRLSTSTPIKFAQFFFNDNPDFLPDKKIIIASDSCIFNSHIDLIRYNFMRWDIEDTNKYINAPDIFVKSGLFKKSWNYSDLNYQQILINDMVKKGKSYQIKGNDPYFVLTTSKHLHEINTLILLRQHVFLIISILFFLLLIFLRNRVSRNAKVKFFMTIVFFTIISSGLLLRFFNSDSLILPSEMRHAAQKPVFQLDSAQVFFNGLNDYLIDQTPGRNNIITMNNLIEYSVFRQLLNSRYVHFGKDGWLFYIGDESRENYENRHPLTDEELKTMAEELMARKKWLEERGIKFYLIFPRLAHFVYEENIGPRMWRYNKKSKLEQLLEYLEKHTDLDVIDVYTPIMEAKKTSPVDLYFRDNTHWNHFGGYVAYQAIIHHIAKDFPNVGKPMPLNDIIWVPFDTYRSDLLTQMAVDKYFTKPEVKPFNREIQKNVKRIVLDYKDFKTNPPPLRFDNIKNKDKPTMILFGDSYAGALLYYLAYNFSSFYFLNTPDFHTSIIEKEKPDIVILQIANYNNYKVLLKKTQLPSTTDTIK